MKQELNASKEVMAAETMEKVKNLEAQMAAQKEELTKIDLSGTAAAGGTTPDELVQKISDRMGEQQKQHQEPLIQEMRNAISELKTAKGELTALGTTLRREMKMRGSGSGRWCR